MSRIDVTAPPTPSLDGLSGQFYDHCRRHQLSFQRCSRCHRWRHIPRLTCAECGSDAWSWHISSGRGVVYSSTVIHRALHPGLEDATPFVCAIVEMDEGCAWQLGSSIWRPVQRSRRVQPSRSHISTSPTTLCCRPSGCFHRQRMTMTEQGHFGIDDLRDRIGQKVLFRARMR